MEANNLLSLYKEFRSEKRPKQKFDPVFNKRVKSLDIDFIDRLIEQFQEILKYYSTKDLLGEYIVFTVYCTKIMAKSNRISWLFSFDSKQSSEFIIGSSFFGEGNSKQSFTYCLKKSQLDIVIQRLNDIKQIISNNFKAQITKEKLKFLNDDKELFKEGFGNKIKKSYFIDTCGELTYIDHVAVMLNKKSSETVSVVTLFKIPGLNSYQILAKLGIYPLPFSVLDDVILLSGNDLRILSENASYLIAYQSEDFSKYDYPDFSDLISIEHPSIPMPSNEPIIGVIDGPFSKGHNGFVPDAYFSDWVECVDDFENGKKPDKDTDYFHGTKVSSLIVDLPNLNPDIDDGCGRFRVRHFGIAIGDGVNTSFMMKKIKEIVEDPKNSDIKVWNISLGNKWFEINNSYISPEGSLLDELQTNNPNIVFVVSGTNRPQIITKEMKIGAPADSINSIVVNSCRFDGTPASYSRCGPALSFFIKPDISTYGGDNGEEIAVWSPYGKCKDCGTSFAAPLIARKMSYLMDVLKLNRNVAKALLIDAATNWSKELSSNAKFIGRGIVKAHISDILKSQSDEIKFYIEGCSKLYSTYTYSLPIPIRNDGKYPYRAKATLCYFPKCSRKLGVDYTNVELSIRFGRLNKDGRIDSIEYDKDYYNDGFLFEKDARDAFRKWDNVKTIIDHTTEKKMQGLIVKNNFNKNWGISVTYQDRIDPVHKTPITWGLVITLKAVDGINRINDFIKTCELNGWLVSEINYENSLIIKNDLSEDIEFEE